MHQGKKYQCRECDYKTNSKGNLAQHKRAVHEGVKYQCRECDHQSSRKDHLAHHKRARHVQPSKKKQGKGVPLPRRNLMHFDATL